MPSDSLMDCPKELVEDSYLAQLDQVETVWARLRKRLRPPTLSQLTDCVFMMLKPDSLVSGACAELLAGMAEAGWQIVHAEATLTAEPRHFEELYQYNLTIRNEQNMMCAWWINARLYDLGPSVALLVRIPPMAGLTAHQQVKRLKGPSNPFLGGAGELRWRAGASNLALNLLHSADDPISTAREFLIFGSENQLEQALLRSATGPVSAGDSALPDEAVREQLFVAGTGQRRLDLPTVLTLVKSKLRAAQGDPKLVTQTRDVYRRYRELVDEPLDIGLRWARFKVLCDEERSIVDKLPNAQTDLALLRHLATPSDYCFATAEATRAELFRRKITLDPWDELALETSLYYSQLLP